MELPGEGRGDGLDSSWEAVAAATARLGNVASSADDVSSAAVSRQNSGQAPGHLGEHVSDHVSDHVAEHAALHAAVHTETSTKGHSAAAEGLPGAVLASPHLGEQTRQTLQQLLHMHPNRVRMQLT